METSGSVYREFETAVNSLNKFCEEEAGLKTELHADKYPFCIHFKSADDQTTLYDETSSDVDMKITVGLSTKIEASRDLSISSKIMKKLISMTEKAGRMYYQAFRAAESDKNEE